VLINKINELNAAEIQEVAMQVFEPEEMSMLVYKKR
jgi:hypothetical protein